MRSSAETRGPRARLRYLTTLSLLAAAALSLFLFESILPSPVPWVRLGLANVMTVTVLFLYGVGPALLLTALRILLGSLLLGTFLSPAFFLAAAGGAASLGVMAIARRALVPPLGIVGVSVLGAAAHNAGQLGALTLLFLHDAEGLRLLPYLILSATLLGALTGLSARALAAYLNARDHRNQLITLMKRAT
jgi:heptaprenyl diphosphate synthase